MKPQHTDPNYQPIQFSDKEIKDRYERKRQAAEHLSREKAANAYLSDWLRDLKP